MTLRLVLGMKLLSLFAFSTISHFFYTVENNRAIRLSFGQEIWEIKNYQIVEIKNAPDCHRLEETATDSHRLPIQALSGTFLALLRPFFTLSRIFSGTFFVMLGTF